MGNYIFLHLPYNAKIKVLKQKTFLKIQISTFLILRVYNRHSYTLKVLQKFTHFSVISILSFLMNIEQFKYHWVDNEACWIENN